MYIATRVHFHVDIGHVRVLFDIYDGEASNLVGLNFSPFISLGLTLSHFFAADLRKSKRGVVNASDQRGQMSKVILASSFLTLNSLVAVV